MMLLLDTPALRWRSQRPDYHKLCILFVFRIAGCRWFSAPKVPVFQAHSTRVSTSLVIYSTLRFHNRVCSVSLQVRESRCAQNAQNLSREREQAKKKQRVFKSRTAQHLHKCYCVDRLGLPLHRPLRLERYCSAESSVICSIGLPAAGPPSHEALSREGATTPPRQHESEIEAELLCAYRLSSPIPLWAMQLQNTDTLAVSNHNQSSTHP